MMDSRGYTLVELMIVGGIAAVGAAALGSLMLNQSRIDQTARTNVEINSLTTNIQNALVDQASCNLTFTGLSFPAAGAKVTVPLIRKVFPNGAPDPNPVAAVNSFYGGRMIRLSRMELNSSNEVEVEFQRENPDSMGARTVIKRLPVLIARTPLGAFDKCASDTEQMRLQALQDACLAANGKWDMSKTPDSAKCVNCGDGQVLMGWTGAGDMTPICKHPLEEPCNALGPQVARWVGPPQNTCVTCGQPGFKLDSVVGTTPNCSATIDVPSMDSAFKCKPPNVPGFALVNGVYRGTCSASTACQWLSGNWGTCTAGSQARTVECKDTAGLACSSCDVATKPALTKTCAAACTWVTGTWAGCGPTGMRIRTVDCQDTGNAACGTCDLLTKPPTSEACTPGIDCSCHDFLKATPDGNKCNTSKWVSAHVSTVTPGKCMTRTCAPQSWNTTTKLCEPLCGATTYVITDGLPACP